LPDLPAFGEDGLLPPGDYELTLDELEQSHLVTGLDDGEPWSKKHRAFLVSNLRILVAQLWQVGRGRPEFRVNSPVLSAKRSMEIGAA